MPALTTVVTHATGDVFPATDWNLYVRDNANYFGVAGADLASAASLVTTNSFHVVTGTTTIDNITPSGPVKGQRVKVLFSGGPITVRHNGGGTGNIRLTAGLHAGFVAGETLELVYDGTVWQESHRSPLNFSGAGGIIYSGPVGSVPLGHLVEDGSAISRTTYLAWFTNVGTLHGVGDNSTTVNLPDSRGRVDTGFAPSGGHADVATISNNEGGTGVTSTVTLANRRPKHRSTVTDLGHTHTQPRLDAGAGGAVTVIVPQGSRLDGGAIGNSASTGITIGGASDAADAPAYLVRAKLTRI